MTAKATPALHGIELEFNSLHAQREAYIKSQAHEGWQALSKRYDDPAYSGASLQRPALQQLLSDIDSGRVNIVVVYKIDRLTRTQGRHAGGTVPSNQRMKAFKTVSAVVLLSIRSAPVYWTALPPTPIRLLVSECWYTSR